MLRFSWMHATLRDVYSAEGGDRSPLPSFGGNVPSIRHSGYNLCRLVCVIPATHCGFFVPFLQMQAENVIPLH